MGRQGNSSARGTAAGSSSVRKPSAAVYRRRRLAAGGALLLAIVLVVSGFALAGAFRGGSQQASSTQPSSTDSASAASAGAPSASAPATPSASPTPTVAPTPTCNQNLVTVTAATDKPSYGPGENPLLTLKVTNGGTVPCEVNIGTSQMEFLVTSGADRIFSSKDCQASSEDLVKVIAPGASETANFPWGRNRSADGCKAVAAAPGGGGAYYIFTAKLGSRASPKAVFQLN
ncbi:MULTISPECIES: hypothetical protein [Pseudarthrobacter]|uniref:Uncharacterized protein n=1 Tax=Pseudarthrobacter niigatensis TaxID=369935 RepID=A0AAJ1SS44_9MICC|nr:MULTISPECIES: hypothetical protein [Pseudarthrobacter]MDQ0145726.1 hypothetical protein [Pseudarthrobacter niigatensis]MDQ0265580.1 hypothetical protein [Pseudarthrobacter niigatensis]QDG61526.1 hypothetical protein NIBR502771_03825 [Pseudarthrobacter sp. NIBRBAC000502771]QDG90396.1 hypothetical protein NIBR502770_19260 [Pseudarthrobacter sp. NIBRBAC000502770]